MQDKSPRRVLTVDEVRDEYGIPVSTQRLWRAEGRFVPWYRAGTRIVYRRELIERWVEEQEQATRGAHPGSHPDRRQDDVRDPKPRTGTGRSGTPFDRTADPSVAGGLATRTGGDGA
jgi:hypothetical protein